MTRKGQTLRFLAVITVFKIQNHGKTVYLNETKKSAFASSTYYQLNMCDK